MSNSQEINLVGSNDDIARWIWNNLVPTSGQADSVQGEILRAIEKLRWETQENGNINWDEGFEMLVDFLQDTLENEKNFSRETKTLIASDLQRLRKFRSLNKLRNDPQFSEEVPYIKDDLYDRLVENLILFCRQHPQIIPRNHDPKQYQ